MATIADAYWIQREQVRGWLEAGDAVRGHKIGLVSEPMQRQMGVHEPDYGHLTASMFHREHAPIRAPFIQPLIEPEIAFVIGSRLRGPGVTSDDVERAVAYGLLALEIVDSRIQDWRVTIVDTIADNASSGGVILGDSRFHPADCDLRSIGCTLLRNGVPVETGTGAAVLGMPLNAVAWLANSIGALGTALEPGDLVLSGSMTRAVPIASGDTITADLTGIGAVTAVLA
jgi:2-keto-4-pentenoate hydratase